MTQQTPEGFNIKTIN